MVVRTGGQMRFSTGVNAATGWAGTTLRAAVGDLTGDGKGDLVAKVGSNPVQLYPGTGSGTFGAPTRTYPGLAPLDMVTAVGDFDGDGTNDLVGRVASTRELRLYPGRTSGAFGTPVRLASSWGYVLTTGVGDLDGDGHPDLVARSGDTLSLIRGTGTGLRAAVALPGSWKGFDVVTGRGDLTGDRVPDLVARDAATKDIWVYPGNGAGGFGQRLGRFVGFSATKWFMVGGNFAGSGAPDVVGLGRDGATLRVFPNSGRTNLGTLRDTGIVLDGINLLLNVGDWDADGRGDVMYRVASTGAMVLRRGLGNDRFAAPVVAAQGWNGVTLVAAVGDTTGDGYPDLMGRGSDGRIRIYPSNGSTGFKAGYVAYSAISGDRQVGAGLVNGDGAPDNLVRRTDGTLWLWSGNGPGGLMRGTQVGSGTAGYSWFKSIGDLDGDGRVDVVARDRSGALWMMPGTSSGLAPRRLVGTGFNAYDYAG
jgi:hypothetical protein